MPVAAAELANGIGAAARSRFVRDMLSLERADPVALAGAWEAWLKNKESLGRRLRRAATGRLAAALGGRPGAGRRWPGRVRFFPDQQAALQAQADKVPLAALLTCYNELQRLRRVATHPLNLRLVLDDMLLRYARLVAR